MAIRAFQGKAPLIAASAYIDEMACIIGDVEIGEESSVWPCAGVRADFAPIRIGSGTHIEDNSVLHTGEPLTIGDRVTVGHAAVVHCRSVGDRCLIGNGAILLDGAEIGDGCVIAAGAVVRPGTKIPAGSFVTGVPAEVKGSAAEILGRRAARRATTSADPARIRGYADLITRYKAQGDGERIGKSSEKR